MNTHDFCINQYSWMVYTMSSSSRYIFMMISNNCTHAFRPFFFHLYDLIMQSLMIIHGPCFPKHLKVRDNPIHLNQMVIRLGVVFQPTNFFPNGPSGHNKQLKLRFIQLIPQVKSTIDKWETYCISLATAKTQCISNLLGLQDKKEGNDQSKHPPHHRKNSNHFHECGVDENSFQTV